MKSKIVILFKNITFWIIFPLAILIAWYVYNYFLGNPENFVDGDPNLAPLPNNYPGIIYKGGPMIILLIAFQVVLLTFTVERLIVIAKARGKGSKLKFTSSIKQHLEANQIDRAIETCDQTKGSVANVLRNTLAGLHFIKKLPVEERSAAVVKDLKESIKLEVPVLNENLSIISTLASISTLAGLLGTVLGMIKSFSALAMAGSPDTNALASGISQALVTTALGISTALVAIVVYNYLTRQIDKIVQHIEELGLVMKRHVEQEA